MLGGRWYRLLLLLLFFKIVTHANVTWNLEKKDWFWSLWELCMVVNLEIPWFRAYVCLFNIGGCLHVILHCLWTLWLVMSFKFLDFSSTKFTVDVWLIIRRSASWRGNKFWQLFELHWGRSKPCHCDICKLYLYSPSSGYYTLSSP